MMKLECPHCFITLDISEWNKEVANSVTVGRADELIPLDLEPEDWDNYRTMHGGGADCPECEEFCVFDDMEGY